MLAAQPPENAFFEFFLRRLSTTQPPALPVYPAGGDPSPSAPGQTAQHRQHQNQGGQVPGQTARPKAGHVALVCTRYQTGRAGQIVQAAGRWRAGNSSIMRIMIALSQAWYIDSNMNKYHKDILLFLVIVNCYLSIDI